MGHAMHLDVVRVPIAAEVVVCDHHLRASVTDDLHERHSGLEQIGTPEAVRPIIARHAHHPRVAKTTGATEQLPIGHVEFGHRGRQFSLSMRSEIVVLVGGQMCDVVEKDLTLLTEGARDERDLGTFGDVFRHGGAGRNALVVGMCVDEQDASIHAATVPRGPMRHDDPMATTDTFPRQKARTRGFQLGRPRSFAIAGGRVLFIRSAGGTDPVGSLWAVDPDGHERLVVDARALLSDDDHLPDAERARRERMREVTSGITAFDISAGGERACFTVAGQLFVADVASGVVTNIQTPGAVVDPRIDSTGSRIAFVSDRALWFHDATNGRTRALVEPTHDLESWGLADFIGAEELSRHRGHWWLADRLLVERVDERPVAVRWIGDPAAPEREPVPHRYPQAGTDNANLAFFLVDVEGHASELTWDHQDLPYVAGVHVAHDTATITLMNREQRRACIAVVPADADEMRIVAERTDAHWVDAMPGVPRVDASGRLLEIRPDEASDTYRLFRDDVALTPAGLQIRALIAEDADQLVVLGSARPEVQSAYRVTRDAVLELTDDDAFASVIADDDVLVIASSRADRPGTTFEVVIGDQRTTVANLAEEPLAQARPTYATAGDRGLRAALLWPSDHTAGTKLPVIMSPYGGPHAQRVVRSAMAFATEQWLADQGFAVVVIDGRGTPGRGPAWERAISEDLAAVVLDDQVDGLQALGAQFTDLDLTRVGIRGWSFGGYLSALAVLDRPDVFQAAVAGAPVTDWVLYDTAYSERYLGHPAEHPDAYARSSLLERADRLTRPLLLVHGLADDNVLAAHTLQLSSALLAAGRTHSVVPLSGVTHMTPQEAVAENLLKLEVEFFRTHLT